MIGNLIKGRGARGVMDYLLASTDQTGNVRPRVKIVGGTFAGRDAREIAAEFGALHRLRPKLGVHVIHQSLRLPDEDAEPDDAVWSAIAQSWADEMGIDDFVAVAHGDGHIHIAGSRIRRDASVVPDQHDYKRSEAAIRKIEIGFNLTVVESSHLLDEVASVNHHKAPTRGQMIYNEITGETPPALFVAAVIDDILNNGASVTSLITQLEASGVKVHPNIASTGRMNGLAYEVDGIRVTSKAMGRGFTWKHLQERGLSYEPSRDDEELRYAKSRRQIEASEQLGTEGGDRATVRRDTDVQSIRKRHREGRAEVGGADGEHLSVEPTEREAAAQDDHSNISSGSDNDIRGDDLDRLVYLAAAEHDSGRSAGDLTNAGRPDQPRDERLAALADHLARDLDRCGQQVGQFVQAIGAVEYQIMTRIPDTEVAKVKRRKWNAVEIMAPQNVKWLRSENVRGAGVYVRALDKRITLLDDVTLEGIEALTSNGFKPSATVETSADNYQAWIRLVPSDQPEPSSGVAKIASRNLTLFSSGDIAAVGSERFGRMPGFTNRKAKHENNRGLNPWVTLKAAAYTVAFAGYSLISRIEVALQKRADKKAANIERRNASIDILIDRDATLSFIEVENLFLRGLDYSSAQQGLTQSEIDFRACGFALKHGSTYLQVEDVLLQHSPDIETRHPKTADYVQRTVRNAARSDYARSAVIEGNGI